MIFYVEKGRSLRYYSQNSIKCLIFTKASLNVQLNNSLNAALLQLNWWNTHRGSGCGLLRKHSLWKFSPTFSLKNSNRTRKILEKYSEKFFLLLKAPHSRINGGKNKNTQNEIENKMYAQTLIGKLLSWVLGKILKSENILKWNIRNKFLKIVPLCG